MFFKSVAIKKRDALLNLYGRQPSAPSTETMPNMLRLIPLLFMLEDRRNLWYLEFRLITLGTRKPTTFFQKFLWKIRQFWGGNRRPTDTLKNIDVFLRALGATERVILERDIEEVIQYIHSKGWSTPENSNETEFPTELIVKNLTGSSSGDNKVVPMMKTAS